MDITVDDIERTDIPLKPVNTEPLNEDGTNVENIQTGDVHEEKNKSERMQMIYYVNDTPPWYLCMLLGFQQYLTMFGATVAMPLILAPALCLTNSVHLSELLSTCFFVSGLITIIQVTLGIRLPIIQGGTFGFLTPAFAILSLPQFQCPAVIDTNEITNNTMSNLSLLLTTEASEHTDSSEIWMLRIREIQGAILVASLLQIVIGVSGLIGIMLKFITPIVIAPTISLIGLSLFKSASNFCSTNWWIAIMTMILITIFSQYMRNLNFPCCSYSKGRGCKCKAYPVFKLFPIILGICLSWTVCAVLTVSNAIPDDENHWAYKTRIDTKSDVLFKAKWFRIPYPGQWGLPTVSAAGVFGMMSGVLAGVIESVGDYYACAKLSGAPPPPVHAINRGILIEGLGCIMAGIWGTGSGTTSYSENIGAIGITKVSSRRVTLYGAGLMIILGMLGKFGALFVTIPDPIIGGVFMIMFGMVAAVGISNLQHIDMNSSRNLFIFGFALMFGLSFPEWMQNPDNASTLNTGYSTADQIFKVLLSTSMFVGGIVAFILDNTVPGSDEERGLTVWKKQVDNAVDDAEDVNIYNLPCGMSSIKTWQWTKYVPVCPSFSGFRSCKRHTSKSNQQ